MRLQDTNASRGLAASDLKVLACAAMLLDHIGARLLPEEDWLRVVGRLAFPIFAFFIAEGCRYTRHRLKHFLMILGLGVLCESVYIVYDGAYYGNILLTFSLSIILIYCLQWLKLQLCTGKAAPALLAATVFVTAFAGVYVYTQTLGVDYGFFGVLAPLVVSIWDFGEGKAPAWLERCDRLSVKLASLAVALILVATANGVSSTQFFSLLSLPLLCFYNGKPGNRRLKYVFYAFYPLHLLAIEFVAMMV